MIELKNIFKNILLILFFVTVGVSNLSAQKGVDLEKSTKEAVEKVNNDSGSSNSEKPEKSSFNDRVKDFVEDKGFSIDKDRGVCKDVAKDINICTKGKEFTIGWKW